MRVIETIPEKKLISFSSGRNKDGQDLQLIPGAEDELKHPYLPKELSLIKLLNLLAIPLPAGCLTVFKS